MVSTTHRVSEAEAVEKLPELLDRLAAGEQVLIERDAAGALRLSGEPAAATAPEAASQPPRPEPQPRSPVEVVEEMREKFCGMFGDATLEEVMSWKHEGHHKD